MAKKQQPRRKRHVPLRTCVVCGDRVAKRDLVRIVLTADEGPLVDPSGRRSGRGAYLCHKDECWDRARKGRALDKALRTTLSQDEKDKLAAQRPIAPT